MGQGWFEDKVAFVTGGSAGIGAAIARHLAALGVRVALTFVGDDDGAAAVADEIAADGSRAITLKADSSSPDALKAAISKAVETFGRIDFLVNNAGIGTPGTIDTLDLDTFEKSVAINLRGVFVAIKAVLPHMPAGGRIINIGSISSSYVPSEGRSLYTMTKAGIQGLTRGLTREMADRGITINNVEPGRIGTGMLKAGLGDQYDEQEAATPLKRFGTPDEVAALVEYLCSEPAGYITGADLRVDGGVSLG